MKRTMLLGAAAALLSLCVNPLAAQRRTEPPKLQNLHFETWQLRTEHAADGEAAFSIYLPKGYDYEANKEKSYPWILWLPGFGGPDDFQTRGGAQVLDQLRGDGAIPELALVVFRAPGRRGRTTYMDGEAIGDIETLLVEDLVAHVEKKFRLGGARERRAIMGVSAGGFGALKIAMRHPDTFGSVAVHSAAILPADPAELAGMTESMVARYVRGGIAEQLGTPIEKAKWQQHMPMGLAAIRKPAELKGLQIYFDAGTDDHYGFFEPNAAFDAELTKHGHRHVWRAVEEGGHAWGSFKMQDNLKQSLRFVGLALSGKDAVKAMTKPAEKAEQAQGDGR